MTGVFYSKLWRRKTRFFRQFLLVAIAFLLASACSGNTAQNQARQTKCQVIKHAMSETCVPKHPQRIVTFDVCTLEDTLALGIKPVGTVGATDTDWSHLQDKLEGVENVGVVGEPNLEKTLALKPDLILGIADVHKQIYNQSSQIAPTVLIEFEGSGDWKEMFAQVGETLGKSDRFQQVMNNYYARLEELKAKMGDRLNQTQVSVVRLYSDGTITLYTKGGLIGTILEDAGLPRPVSQNLDQQATLAKEGNTVQYSISRELFNYADGDVLFLITNEDEPELQKQLQKLKADPIWSQLRAVQQSKVYEVPYYWIGCSPITANLVIDDLFKYLFSNIN